LFLKKGCDFLAILVNPFVATAPKEMTNIDLAQALRIDMAGEIEAIIGYEAHATAANDERVKKVLYQIADEERRHVGELQQLLYMLSPKDAQHTEKGKQLIQQQQAQNFQGVTQ
jgi:uncharacterized protein